MYRDTGWMYGEYEGSQGSFPSEYVQPIVGLRATKDAIEVCSYVVACIILIITILLQKARTVASTTKKMVCSYYLCYSKYNKL